jgi:uncharacterized protein YndB with AHSA1/START domain
MDTSADRIERHIHLKAPRSRVWRAISNAEEFGTWFNIDLKGKTFVAGERMQWRLTLAGYEHLVLDVDIERIEPEKLFSYRWHPYAIDPGNDYSQEPTTLVEFTLQDHEDGTLVTIVESGFDHIPVSRRLEAYRMNSGGWDHQIENLTAYVVEA